MKKRTSITFYIVLFCLLFCLIPTASQAATPKLNHSKLTLCRYHSAQLKLKSASGKISWKSLDKNIATVTKKGKVTAVSAGTTTIVAKNKSHKYSCKVTVKEYDTEIQYAAYGYHALTSDLSALQNLQIHRIYRGSFVSNIKFACFECSFQDKAKKDQHAWIYVYEQAEPSTSCYTLKTDFYENLLVLKFENKGMDSVLSTRCEELKINTVKKASGYIFKLEKMTVKKGENFGVLNQWLTL